MYSECNALHVGHTSCQLKDRLNNHRSDIRLNKATAIGINFNELRHSISISNLLILPISYVSDVTMDERYDIEKKFIKLLNKIYPSGLNHYPLI
jgi:hypothetical protein